MSGSICDREAASTAEAIQIGHAEVMRLFLLAAIALPLLPGQLKDLNRERDADGFGNIKWGMTVAEAKAAFPGLREPDVRNSPSGAFEERLIQPALMIGSVENDCFHPDQGRFRPYHPHRSQTCAALCAAQEDRLPILSNNLIHKYGRPSHHDTAPRGRMKEETEVWVLPSTTITLDWREGIREQTPAPRHHSPSDR